VKQQQDHNKKAAAAAEAAEAIKIIPYSFLDVIYV
jgi:hypothetical protein